MALRSKNLNLIPILQALLHQESVARAADEVCLSQPAMSGALARLREAFDDPILVRVGRSMRLTPRAERMRGQVDRICADIEHLFDRESFDAATAQELFVVAAPDYLVYLLSSVLLPYLGEHAPGIRIRFVDVPMDLPSKLDDGSINMAVCGDFGFWEDLKTEFLFRDHVVVVVGLHHPLLERGEIGSEDLLEFPSLNYTTALTSTKRDFWPRTGIPSLDWDPQISTSQFTDAVLLAATSTTVARAPASLAERLGATLPIKTIELKGEETEFDTAMFWSPVHDAATEHAWLRELIKEYIHPFDANSA